MATHSSVLAWKIPCMEGYKPWGCKESDMTEHSTCFSSELYSHTSGCLLDISTFLFHKHFKFNVSKLKLSFSINMFLPLCYQYLIKVPQSMWLLDPFWLFFTLFFSAAKSLQSCPTHRDPIDCSPPGSSIHGIFQATVLEWGCHCLLFISGCPGPLPQHMGFLWSQRAGAALQLRCTGLSWQCLLSLRSTGTTVLRPRSL